MAPLNVQAKEAQKHMGQIPSDSNPEKVAKGGTFEITEFVGCDLGMGLPLDLEPRRCRAWFLVSPGAS